MYSASFVFSLSASVSFESVQQTDAVLSVSTRRFRLLLASPSQVANKRKRQAAGGDVLLLCPSLVHVAYTIGRSLSNLSKAGPAHQMLAVFDFVFMLLFFCILWSESMHA